MAMESIQDLLRAHGVDQGGKGNNLIEDSIEPTAGLKDGLIWYKDDTDQFFIYASGEFRSIAGDGELLEALRNQNNAKTTAKRNKDDNGNFETVKKTHKNGKLGMLSTLKDPDENGLYRSRVIEYGEPGTKDYKREVYTLKYDEDGALTDEILQ